MITKPKGTYDIFYQEASSWKKLEQTLTSFFAKWNVSYIRTPLFENSELFRRKNDFSEVVQKQTYDFTDKGGRSLTLRPEGTAGVVRAIIENKLYVDTHSNKFYYFGPNYRYERPQKGRFREFYQFGVEVIGDKNYLVDTEIIDMVHQLCVSLGLDVTIKLNYLGGLDTIKKYSDELKNYFTPLANELCQDCQQRLHQNPLRIIDCKIDSQKETITKNLPQLTSFYDSNTKEYFTNITKMLQTLNIPFIVDPLTVRGLDYYTDIVFEVISNKTGQTLAGGGRYDNLISELGGPKLGAIGFAFGCERILSEVEFIEDSDLDYYVLANPAEACYSYDIVSRLRKLNKIIKFDFSNRNFNKKLKDGLEQNPHYLIFIGTDEVSKKTVTIKDTKTTTQVTISKNEFINKLECETNV